MPPSRPRSLFLEVKDNGRLEIFYARKSHQIKHSCVQPDPMQKRLGFKKLAILFVVLVSGIFISIFVVLFEFIAKIYSERQYSNTILEDYDINSKKDFIEEFLDIFKNTEIHYFTMLYKVPITFEINETKSILNNLNDGENNNRQ